MKDIKLKLSFYGIQSIETDTICRYAPQQETYQKYVSYLDNIHFCDIYIGDRKNVVNAAYMHIDDHNFEWQTTIFIEGTVTDEVANKIIRLANNDEDIKVILSRLPNLHLDCIIDSYDICTNPFASYKKIDDKKPKYVNKEYPDTSITHYGITLKAPTCTDSYDLTRIMTQTIGFIIQFENEEYAEITEDMIIKKEQKAEDIFYLEISTSKFYFIGKEQCIKAKIICVPSCHPTIHCNIEFSYKYLGLINLLDEIINKTPNFYIEDGKVYLLGKNNEKIYITDTDTPEVKESKMEDKSRYVDRSDSINKKLYRIKLKANTSNSQAALLGIMFYKYDFKIEFENSEYLKITQDMILDTEKVSDNEYNIDIVIPYSLIGDYIEYISQVSLYGFNNHGDIKYYGSHVQFSYAFIRYAISKDNVHEYIKEKPMENHEYQITLQTHSYSADEKLRNIFDNQCNFLIRPEEKVNNIIEVKGYMVKSYNISFIGSKIIVSIPHSFASMILGNGGTSYHDQLVSYNDDGPIEVVPIAVCKIEKLHKEKSTVLKEEYLDIEGTISDLNFVKNKCIEYAAKELEKDITDEILNKSKKEEDKNMLEELAVMKIVNGSDNVIKKVVFDSLGSTVETERLDKMVINNIYSHVKSVHFNDPYTIIEWDDGTITKVSSGNESYDKEYGVVFCILKRLLGNTSRYYDLIKKTVAKGEEQELIRKRNKEIKALKKDIAKKKAKQEEQERKMKEALEAEETEAFKSTDPNNFEDSE